MTLESSESNVPRIKTQPVAARWRRVFELFAKILMFFRKQNFAAAILAVALGFAGFASATDSPTVTPAGRAQMVALKNLTLSRDVSDRKMDTRLYFAVLTSQRDARMAQFPDLRIMQAESDGLIPVSLISTATTGVKPIVDRILALGGSVQWHKASARNISARVKISDLQTLAQMSQVFRIRQHIPAMTNSIKHSGRELEAGLKTASHSNGMAQKQLPDFGVRRGGLTLSEGVATHGALTARNFYGVNGTGVKICVLSDGVDSLAALVASGDLPAGIDVLVGQAGSGDEGAAMLEIIYDIAPGATLGFATALNTETQFATNILALQAAGCNIIVDDIIYLAESPFQDGIIAQAVNTVTAAGVLYFSSAGNEGNRLGLTSGTWEGDFLSTGVADPAPLAGADLHNFGDGGNSILVEVGGGNPPLLIWAESYDQVNGLASTDFDLYDMNSTLTTIFDASTDVQDGVGGDDFPIEFIGGGAFAGERLVVDRFAAGATSSVPMFNLILFRGELADALTTRGTTRGHSAAAAAFSVAATPSGASFDGSTAAGPFPGLFTAANELEGFSADGPRRIILSPAGAELTPGNRTSTGGVVRQKPDITAADGVSTSAPGFATFYGTSAAAPHAAAIAGLMKQSVPAATPAQIRNALVTSAIDIQTAGADAESGAGIIMAGPAIAALGGVPQAFIVSGGAPVPTQVAGDGDASIEPNEDFALSIPLTNSGGLAATAISATLTSSTPGVTIYQATSTYPNLAPAATGSNATPYLFNVGSSLVCGSSISFTLTVAYTGGPSPQVLNYSLTTGVAGTPVTTSYTGAAVAIPDGADLSGTAPGAPVDATLAVATAGGVFDVDFRIDGAACNATGGSITNGIDHSFVNDLRLSLVSPAGTVINVINNTDGGGNNFCQTVLDDESAGANIQTVSSAMAPFTGSFTPNASLGGFDGQTAAGNWILRAQDFFSQDTGNIRSWSLIITPAVCNAPVQPSNLTASKTVSGIFIESSTVTYTLVVTNTGTGIQPDNAGNEFVDVLPAGLTLVSASATAGTTSTAGNTVNWNGLLLPAGTTTITISATINAGTAGTQISNQATVNYDADRNGSNEASRLSDDPGVGGATDPTVFTVIAIAELTIALSDSPDPVAAGANLTYTALVTNIGPSAATGVTVSMPVPANTTFVSGSVAGGGSCVAGASIVCTFTGTVAVGSPRAVTIVVLVGAATPNATVINATATVATTATDPVPGNNSATATTTVATSANLALTFGASTTQTTLNVPVAFTASSQNLGPSDAQNVSITITLSPDFRYSSHSASAGATCTVPQIGRSGVITCTWAGTTAVNATRTLAVNAYSNSPGNSSIMASTTSATTDPVLANNNASQIVQVGAEFEPISALDRYGLIVLGVMLGLIGMVAVRRNH